MLDIQELDYMICQWLSRSDLAQCAQVSKKWHSVVIPHLWRDLSWISLKDSYKSVAACYNMVLEDYLAEQRHQELRKEQVAIEDPSQGQSVSPSSVLLKYGHLIRRFPACDLEAPTPAGKGKAPTFYDLLLHFLKRCSPQVQVSFVSVDLDELDLGSDNAKKMILDFTLPRLHHLSILADFQSAQDLMDMLGLLDRHAVILESLSLDVDFSGTGAICTKEDQGERPKGWTSLQRLSFHRFASNSDIAEFLPWLLKRCGSVKGLMISEYTGSAQCLLEGMLTYLPNLNEIILGDDCFGVGRVTDEVMAQLLSGSSNGWKTVRFGLKARLGGATMDALARHFSSLEMLDLNGCLYVTSDQLVQILGSCAQLHTLSIINPYHRTHLHDAKAFIDVDPNTGSLRPWQCERTLKALMIRITGIPRPDLKEDDVVVEAYPGQARELPGQVYDRLARLTNLETLWLGKQDSQYRSDGLEMSLESGLGKLSGLTKLRELDVTGVRTRVGIREAQWMSEHWPRLRSIRGLCDRVNEEALRWLQENRPSIEVVAAQ